jgi:hypothetical protein
MFPVTLTLNCRPMATSTSMFAIGKIYTLRQQRCIVPSQQRHQLQGSAGVSHIDR